MREDNALDKTNRVNLLFDFYGPLLTDKQRIFLTYYFHEDFSLGEIADEFQISRQAVYEHVKRAGQIMEEYESKLRLLAKYERRMQLLGELRETVQHCGCEQSGRMRDLIRELHSSE